MADLNCSDISVLKETALKNCMDIIILISTVFCNVSLTSDGVQDVPIVLKCGLD